MGDTVNIFLPKMSKISVSNLSSRIKEYFRGKGSLLVKILVGQALLIGILTFFYLTRDNSNQDTEPVLFIKYIILVPVFFLKYLMVFFMVLLGCDGKQEDPGVAVNIIDHVSGVDDDSIIKLLETVLLFLLLGVLAVIMFLWAKSFKRKNTGETILKINSKGDWEYAPSKKREAAVKF